MHSVGWRRRSRGYRSTQWEDATNILGVALGLGPLPSSDGDTDSVVEPHSGESNVVVATNDVVGDAGIPPIEPVVCLVAMNSEVPVTAVGR